MSEELKGREIVVRLPASLEPFRAAAGKGLFYLTLAQSQPPVPEDKTKPMRIKLSADDLKHLNVCTALFGSERAALTAALSWVKAQPALTQCLLLGGLSSSQTTNQGESTDELVEAE